MSQVDAENVDVRSLDEALGENASEKASVPKTSVAYVLRSLLRLCPRLAPAPP